MHWGGVIEGCTGEVHQCNRSSRKCGSETQSTFCSFHSTLCSEIQFVHKSLKDTLQFNASYVQFTFYSSVKPFIKAQLWTCSTLFSIILVTLSMLWMQLPLGHTASLKCKSPSATKWLKIKCIADSNIFTSATTTLQFSLSWCRATITIQSQLLHWLEKFFTQMCLKCIFIALQS